MFEMKFLLFSFLFFTIFSLPFDLLDHLRKGHIEESLALLKSDEPVDINQVWPETGETALIFASPLDSYELVKLLIEKGANVNQRCAQGTNPIQFAIINNNIPILELLLDQ